MLMVWRPSCAKTLVPSTLGATNETEAYFPKSVMGGALVAPGAEFAVPKSGWCIGTIDVPGSPSARGTASAFAHLALLMNASMFGVQVCSRSPNPSTTTERPQTSERHQPDLSY